MKFINSEVDPTVNTKSGNKDVVKELISDSVIPLGAQRVLLT